MQWLEQQGAVEEIIALYKDILNYYWKKNTAVDGVEEDAGAKKKILKEYHPFLSFLFQWYDRR
jgi:hypothetical protein